MPPSARATEAQRLDEPGATSAALRVRVPEAQPDPEAVDAPRPSAPPSPCPPEMARVGAACVDRYEAHLVVRNADGSTRRHPEYERPKDGVRYEARSQAGVRPQAYVSSLEAASACENAGKRLCSLAEWTKACRGPDDETYPYGDEFRADTCNTRKKHVLAEVHGKDPMNWSYDDFNDPELIKQGLLAPAGEWSACTNEYGTFDMVGNLHEWTSDRVDRTLPSKVPLTPKIRRTVTRKRGFGIFMGGFFSTYSQHGEGCEFITIAHEPKYHDYSTGFRCCKDAEQ